MKLARRALQLVFLTVTLLGTFAFAGHTEQWCPFGGVEALYSYATQGNFTCSLGVSNFYILGALLLVTLLFRRAFCGYVCPIGTLGEWLRAAAAWLHVPLVRPPYRVDRALALLKYPLLVLILYFTWRVGELVLRGYDPCYVLISRHGKDITVWAYIIAAGVVLASLVLIVPFCKWFCPLAAVFTPFSRVALTRVQRHPAECTECGECTSACPMNIRVAQAHAVTAARCTSCLDCVAACPSSGALTWGPPSRSGRTWPQAAVIVTLLAGITAAVAATYVFPMASFVHERGAAPSRTASVELTVAGVRCRGTSAALVEHWLGRDDDYALRGYLRIEIWPAPDAGRVRVTYDPATDSAGLIKRAIVAPRFDLASGRAERSPYAIEDYTPSVDDL